MAIAYDTSTTLHQGASGLSFAHTCTGSNLILFVAAFIDLPNSVTGITYNGTAMTRITFKSVASTFELSLWYVVNPSTGANNIVVTGSGSPTISAWSSSFTGAKQSGQPDASGTKGPTATTTFNQSVTTVADNSWAVWVGYTGSGATDTAGTNTVKRVQDTALVGAFLADSGTAKTPAGSFQLNMSTVASSTWEAVMASFAPAVASAGNSNFFNFFNN